MPGDKTASLPNDLLRITFTEKDHSYVDEYGVSYTSVTTLVHNGFEKFDACVVAHRKSQKPGVPPEQYIKSWAENRDRAATDGTRMHENCEHQILGEFDKMHSPVDENERAEFRAAWMEVEKIRSAGFMYLEPEKLVFSPRFRVAGSIDLLCCKTDKKFLLLDWKRVKKISRAGFQGKTGIEFPTRQLQDCNFIHYSLQLSIYEQILKMENYIPQDAVVDKWLNVYNKETAEFDHIQCMDLSYSALAMMAWNVTSGEYDVPF